MVKPSFFKKVLSYFYPIVLERVEGKIGHELEVRLENGRIVLNSKTANYSFGSLHKVWRKALAKIDIPSGCRVLVLGAGAGSVRTIIHQEMGVDAHLTMIEADEAVLKIGPKYFGFVDGPLLNIVQADAFEYCSSTKERFDLILIDLFIDMDLPEELLSTNFWIDIQHLSSPGSRVILNTIVHNEASKAIVARIAVLLGKMGEQRQDEVILGINHLFSFCLYDQPG